MHWLKMNTSLSESDILFSPNRWSKRFPANIVFEKHVEIINKYSEEVRKQLTCYSSISYGPGERETIDIYGTDLADDVPIFIHIHGGYWQEEAVTHNNNSFPAKCLHKNGIKSMFVGYELCPNVTLEEILFNIEKALYKCLEYAKMCKSRGLHLSGHSAGAHLVVHLFKSFIPSLTVEDQKLFKSVFLLCGLYDLLPLIDTLANQILELDEESAKAASPLNFPIFASGTNFYVIVVQHDSPVFLKQGKQFSDYLLSLGLSSKYILLENVDHYEVMEKLVDEDFQLTQLIIHTING